VVKQGEVPNQEVLQKIRQSLAQRRVGMIGRYTKTAVLVPLVWMENGELGVLFEERSHTMRRQPGEISFPGGHFEHADGEERVTAVRETSEELGVPHGGVHVLGELDIFAASSGLTVYPFVGWIEDYPNLSPNADEVERVFVLDLNRLLETQPKVYTVPLRPNPPHDFPYHLIPNGRDYAWRVSQSELWFYELDGIVIWGLTARILRHFLEVVQMAPETLGSNLT